MAENAHRTAVASTGSVRRPIVSVITPPVAERNEFAAVIARPGLAFKATVSASERIKVMVRPGAVSTTDVTVIMVCFSSSLSPVPSFSACNVSLVPSIDAFRVWAELMVRVKVQVRVRVRVRVRVSAAVRAAVDFVFGRDLQCQLRGMSLGTRMQELEASRRGNQWHPRVQITVEKTRTVQQPQSDGSNPNTTESMVKNAHRTGNTGSLKVRVKITTVLAYSVCTGFMVMVRVVVRVVVAFTVCTGVHSGKR
jgi:hypothetical protein